MRLLPVLLASLVALAFAAPAMAQDGTVGQGQVITDIATETEPPPGEDDGTDIPPVDDGEPAAEPEPDASGRRGEVHVLDSATESEAPATPAPVSVPATATPPTAAASSAPITARPHAAAASLPFTGVDAGPLVLIGLALLGSGVGLLAVLRQPVK
jgi:hypothetical protein